MPGSPNYTRKTIQPLENVVGDSAIGVKTGDVTRVLDRLIQRQMWTESAGGSYTATKSEYHGRLDTLFGKPGDTTSLDGIFNAFTQSLQTLATSPDNATARSEVLNSAQVLAQQLNGMSTDIQSLRSQAELAIAGGVEGRQRGAGQTSPASRPRSNAAPAQARHRRPFSTSATAISRSLPP